MSAHTPGPWMLPHLADDSQTCNCRTVCCEHYCGSICVVSVDNGIKSIGNGGNDCPPLEEAKANARLITAAPDLLEALYRLVTEAKLDGMAAKAGWDCWINLADEALAKAKGA